MNSPVSVPVDIFVVDDPLHPEFEAAPPPFPSFFREFLFQEQGTKPYHNKLHARIMCTKLM